jgi:hypothetical protein
MENNKKDIKCTRCYCHEKYGKKGSTYLCFQEECRNWRINVYGVKAELERYKKLRNR